MGIITATVGEKGANHRPDVIAIQKLLNQRVSAFGMEPLRTEGDCDSFTMQAIRNFQIRSLGMAKANGRISPEGPVIDALQVVDEASISRERRVAGAAKLRLSGKAWFDANQAKYPNSSQTSDLAPGFGAMADHFIDALETAGAMVNVSATRRNKTRAWLMHHAWVLAHGAENASAIEPNPECDIIWDHGTTKETVEAAKQMVTAFGIAFKPSLTSHHIRGLAIDMTIDWSGPIRIFDARGKPHDIDKPRGGAANTVLHTIGASYGCKKLLTDPPHWSIDGH